MSEKGNYLNLNIAYTVTQYRWDLLETVEKHENQHFSWDDTLSTGELVVLQQYIEASIMIKR